MRPMASWHWPCVGSHWSAARVFAWFGRCNRRYICARGIIFGTDSMHIIQSLLSADEVSVIRRALESGEFVDGKLTAGAGARQLKNNLQLKRESLDAGPLDGTIVNALARSAAFQSAAMPFHYSAPLYSKYGQGMNYGAHVDSAFMGPVGSRMRSDLSMTIFLKEPAEYEGGELVLEQAGANYAIKLPAGQAILYPTYALHQVNPVTSGERLVCVLWIQSMVRDPAMRQILTDLHAALGALLQRQPDSVDTMLVQKSYSNLLRLVIET